MTATCSPSVVQLLDVVMRAPQPFIQQRRLCTCAAAWHVNLLSSAMVQLCVLFVVAICTVSRHTLTFHTLLLFADIRPLWQSVK